MGKLKMSGLQKILFLQNARMAMACMTPSEALLEEQSVLEDLETDYQSGRVTSARKKAFSQSYNLSRSGRSKPSRSMNEK
jgi:Ca-activated chloride channel family protein